MLGKSASALAAAGIVLATLAPLGPASAAVGVDAGVLSCQVDSGWGFIFGASRKLRCTYSGGGRVEHYAGEISKFGVDIGYQQSGVIIWGVLAPTATLAPGALAGDYGGVTASAAVDVGGGGNVLIGGSSKSISLQPLSVEGEKGVNVAAGIAAVTLRAQS